MCLLCLQSVLIVLYNGSCQMGDDRVQLLIVCDVTHFIVVAVSVTIGEELL